jgi:hypothetical protein
MAYLDTSLLAAYYCPEPLSEAAQRVVMETPEPTVSRLVEVELYSAVAMKVRMGGLDTRSAGRITSLFQAHLAGGSYHVVPLDAREFAVARDWLGRFDTPLRTLDALHLAAAFANNLPLLTADRNLAKAAALLGVDHGLIG